MKFPVKTFLAAGALAVAGCGSAAYPQQQLLNSKSALSAAEAVEAEKEPQARLHLKLARDQIQEAEKFLEAGKNDAANRALERAESDARLSLAMARAAELQRKGQAAVNKVEELRSESQ